MRSTIPAIFALTLTGCMQPARPPVPASASLAWQYVTGGNVTCTTDPLNQIQLCTRAFTYPENVPGKGYIFCYGGTAFPECASNLTVNQVTLYEETTLASRETHRYWTVSYHLYNNTLDWPVNQNSAPWVLFELTDNSNNPLYQIPIEVPRNRQYLSASSCGASDQTPSNKTSNLPPGTPSVYFATQISYPHKIIQSSALILATDTTVSLNSVAKLDAAAASAVSGVADVDRDLIRTPIAEGRNRAKARGQHMGRPE